MATKKYQYIVSIWDDKEETLTQEQADQVVSERISYDEDYGFHYRIDFDRKYTEGERK